MKRDDQPNVVPSAVVNLNVLVVKHGCLLRARKMSISLPNNKEEKRQRLIMLVKQNSLTVIQANKLYTNYCRLYDKVKK